MTGRRPLLADPTGRLAVGLAGLGLSAALVRADGAGEVETHLFRAVNQLPDALRAPVWVVMQGGNLAAVPVAAVAAAASGRPALARRILVGGGSAWLLAKVVKGCVRRPRPTALLAGARSRGRAQTGLGFVSGHAAVATGLCAAVLPELGPAGRRLTVAGAATVTLSRLYVGAHLPLDAIGGVALGLAVEAAVELAGDRPVTRWRSSRHRGG